MEGRFNQQRRQVVAAGIAGAGLASIGTPALAQARTKIRVGYVDTLAVTGQMWTGVHRGHWAKENIEFDPIKFNTGLELFNAMIGGSLDMLSTGAVISNFPARGQGKAFLINNIEFATAQLWIREDQGVKTWADLKGKRITTTLGTTAHVFLDAALRANGIDPTKDVEIVNQTMPVAVTSFISGAVPAVALWVPFNIQVRQRVPAARSEERV
jgi:NitT/TauT family transport system substrate-binding protein